MVLDARDRSSIFTKLVPVLGEQDANSLMSEFPAHPGDELVTTSILHAEMAELRTELRTEMAGLRTDMADLRTEMADHRTTVAEQMQRQTVWLAASTVGSVVGGMGLAATIATLAS